MVEPLQPRGDHGARLMIDKAKTVSEDDPIKVDTGLISIL